MNFSFFEQLTKKEAKLYLDNYLREASKGFNTIIPDLEEGGIICDFSTKSIVPVFAWSIKKIKVFPVPPDLNLPLEIRETDSYKKGLFEYDDDSKVLILRLSYYLGETFVKSHGGNIYWTSGDNGFVTQSMPVIKGFKMKMELPTMLVSQNMISHLIKGSSIDKIKTIINYWVSLVP